MIGESHHLHKFRQRLATPPSALHRLVYTSSATLPWRDLELFTLLSRGRRNNQRDGVTGLLLYRDGNIIQLLEGPEAIVTRTFDRIRSDRRHTGIITLLSEPASGRLFADFAMGFRNLHDSPVHDLPDYSEFLNEDRDSRPHGETSDRAMKLLQLFRQSMR